MTVFFDKKEEVIDLQLTPYGEALLSLGHFKPMFYAFFDDNILYDATNAAGVSEKQNDIEGRIQINTPNVKPQAVFSGIESNLYPLIEDLRYLDDGTPNSDGAYKPIPPNIDQNFSFIEPLGTMNLGSEFAPAWNIRTLRGELTGAINYMTSSVEAGIYSNIKRVPQLEFDINYKALVGNVSEIDVNGPISRDSRLLSGVYEDGTFLYLAERAPSIILAVDEENSSIDLEYDIEVFEVLDDTATTTNSPTLQPMNFLKSPTQIKNGVLLDEPIPVRNIRLDSTFAEYFFLVNCDDEIPPEDICPVLEGVEARGITLNSLPYECPDVEDFGRFDIYGTNAVEDPCDD